ncbi:hypothetical protein JJB07_18075 [Tumebacillus sp. ITR2]|uniref:Uncharacterized protein n=1 Tax=Tumebacillus amylolyticus TaxID=2801339 RepID=A0ABS1JE34_9BACL|nr:hypothetical protein [Tumebacillus amylolyticus]MBL0388514.1 hypothetical protein [Tumebacillus amylolyticus]
MNRLQLALYRGITSDLLTLEDCLNLPPSQQGDVNLQHCTWSLLEDGQERLAHRLSFGPLEEMVAQLDHVRTRLMNFQPALLRSGVFSSERGNYLLFEPDEKLQVVRLSLLMLEESPYSFLLPNGGRGEELYDYVRKNRDERLARTQEIFASVIPQEVPLELKPLLKSLLHDAKRGRTLTNR